MRQKLFHMAQPKSRILLYSSWLIAPIILLVVLEFLLTIFWQNPYLLSNNFDQYTRFYPKGILAYFKVNRLYEGNYRIRIATDDNMAISDGSNIQKNKDAICIGGSTTLNAFVPEGQRWPDLLKLPAYNYGISANTSIDGYYNLKFLIENKIVNARYVFIMFAVNDLRAFLTKGADNFKIAGWSQPANNHIAFIDNADQKIFSGFRVKDSSLLSFARYYLNNFSGRSFYERYHKNRKVQEQLEHLNQEEFDVLLKDLKDNFLPMREKVYSEIYNFSKEHKLQLIFLTQPHAYREDFKPIEQDLRLFPVFRNKKMTLKQSAIVMDILNNQNRKFAQVFGQTLIDVDTCFSKMPSGELFYDSVHYSLNGSIQFASCVNKYLPLE